MLFRSMSKSMKFYFQSLVERDHVLHASLLQTDLALSTPLSASAPPAQADNVAMIEAADASSAFDAASLLAGQIAADQTSKVFVFQMMSRLGARYVPAA